MTTEDQTTPSTPDNLPAFVFKEEQFFGSNGRIVIRRHVVAGKEPEQWREFLGVSEAELPLGEGPDGKMMTKRHEIIFPFFGISTAIYKNPLKCVQQCFKIYSEVEAKAKLDTIEGYKKMVRDHLAKTQAVESQAQSEGKSIIVPGAATVGERHLDRDGNVIPAPGAGKKRSIILGG